VVSVSAFIGAGLFLYSWVRIDYAPDQALLATIWMYIFPMAFFFVAFYGEPLLLLASIASMYFARRSQFVASGLAIAIAGASRGTAFLLAVPFIIEFWQQRDFAFAKWFQFLLGVAFAPVGTLAYLAFLSQSGSGDMLSTYTSLTTNTWQTFYTWPWSTLWDGLKAGLFGTAIGSDWFSRALVWNDLFYGVLGLGLGLWSMRSMRYSAAAFLLAGMIFLLTVHGPYGYALWSTPRRVAVLFPLYLAIALIVCRWSPLYRWCAALVSLIMLGLFSAWFVSGRWVA
jgi:hypothetical protein